MKAQAASPAARAGTKAAPAGSTRPPTTPPIAVYRGAVEAEHYACVVRCCRDQTVLLRRWEGPAAQTPCGEGEEHWPASRRCGGGADRQHRQGERRETADNHGKRTEAVGEPATEGAAGHRGDAE